MSATRVVLALLALVAVACASRPPGNRITTTRDIDFQSALVFPLNVAVEMPSELEHGAERASDAVHAYLVERHKRVETLPYRDAREAWLASAKSCQAAPECQGFDGAAGLLARSLHDGRDYEVLIIPFLVMRPARLQLRSVTWDGVKRSLEIIGNPRNSGNAIELDSSLSGETQAPSLAVFAFSSEGQKLFQGVGGLDLCQRVRVVPGKSKNVSAMRWGFELLPDLFPDPQLLREGVSIAFDPLVPREDPRGE